MSTDDTLPGHPDLEALSAHADGETAGAEASTLQEHVAGCAECRTKLRWLRTASALVATPVPPRVPSARDRAIARALDSAVESTSDITEGHRLPGTAESRPGDGDGRPARAGPFGAGDGDARPARAGRSGAADAAGAGDGRSARAGDVGAAGGAGGAGARSSGGGGGGGGISGGRPVPSRPGPAAPIPITAGRRRSRGGDRSGVWIGVGSAAAVVVAILVGVGVLGQGTGRDENTTVAAGPTQERTATDLAGDSVGGAGVSGALAAPPDLVLGVNGGDLGDIADATTLAQRAQSVLVQRQVAPEAAAPAGIASAEADADLTPKVVGTRPCEMEVRSARSGLGTVVYFATGRVQGVPVVVLGFDPAPDVAGPVTLLALAQAGGCRVVLEAAGP